MTESAFTRLLGLRTRPHGEGGWTPRSWFFVRLWCLGIFIAVLGTFFTLRSSRGPAPWAELLSEHGALDAGKVHWVQLPAPGQWALGIVSARPAPKKAHSPKAEEVTTQAHDLFIFEGMSLGKDQPFAVRSVGNITRTADAEDVLLSIDTVSDRRRIAVGRQHAGAFNGVDLLDLSGDPLVAQDERGESRSRGDEMRIRITQWQQHERWDGIGRRSYAFAKPVDSLEAFFVDGRLELLGEEGGRKRKGILQPTTGEIVPIEKGHTLGLIDQSEVWVLGNWTHFIVNRVREVPWIGSGKIAALEKVVFGLVEFARGQYYDVAEADFTEMRRELGGDENQALEEIRFEPAADSVHVGTSRDPWPPQNIKPLSLGLPPIPNEGTWRPWVPAWRSAQELKNGPWPIYRTALRVNPKRTYDYITLVAIDLRQMDLRMMAGTANPTSTTGYRGKGKIPRDPAFFQDDLIVFNGGFKSEHGSYGMMVHNKVISPARPGAATLAVDKDGRVHAGIWPGIKPESAYSEKKKFLFRQTNNAKPIPDHLDSFRQNLPPLVAEGKINPAGVRRWGGVVDYLTDASTPRSSVCLKGDSTLIYIWASASSADELGEAHLMAGCDFGIHLDMNPFHTGLMMHQVPLKKGALPATDKKKGFTGALQEVAVKRMKTDYYRYLRTSQKDFFYLTKRRHLKHRLTRPNAFAVWSPKGLPVAHKGMQPLALTSDFEDITFLAFDTPFFQSSLVQSATLEEVGAAAGETHIGIALDNAPVEGSWRRDAAKFSSLEGLHIHANGALTVYSGGKGATPTPQELLPGTPVIQDGKLLAVDEPVSGAPVMAAVKGDGDVVLTSCTSCSVESMSKTLRVLGVRSAVLLGTGSLFAVTSDGKGTWSASVSVERPNMSILRLRMVPKPPKTRAQLSTFEVPTKPKLPSVSD